MKAIRILLVDDHQVVREGLKSYFENDPQFVIVGEAANGIEALEMLYKLKTDVVLTDINMPQMDGLQLTQEIIGRAKPPKILVLTTFDEPQYIKQLMNSGADGYLFKNSGIDELKNAILKVYDGETFLSDEVSQKLASFVLMGKSKKPTIKNRVAGDDLTERELEVLKLVIEENSNSEIAEKLSISIRTVEAHKRKMIEKTGVRNLAGLIMYAINNQLIDNI